MVEGRKYKYPDVVGDPREIRVCGIHKRQADKGARILVYTGPKDQVWGSVKFEEYRTEPTEVEALKQELEKVERSASWDRGKPAKARTDAGRAMFEQAPEILEMLYMVAERGDQRAWTAIETIQNGMSEVEKADVAYQAMEQKIADLKARIEKAKEAQA